MKKDEPIYTHQDNDEEIKKDEPNKVTKFKINLSAMKKEEIKEEK